MAVSSKFSRAGIRLKKHYSSKGKKIKLSAKAYSTLKKREAKLVKLGLSKVSTSKGGTRKTARKAYKGKAKVMTSKGRHYKVSAAGKKTRISKKKYLAAKKR